MNAPWRPVPSMRAMHAGDVDAVLEVERSAYGFPWTRGNFIDSLAAGHLAELLLQPGGGLVGYYVALPGVDEMHLLNLTVAPAHQGQGHAGTLLDALEARCRGQRLERIWLEVRDSNQRARQIYRRRGYVEAGRRRGYYPAGPAGREDAVLMSLALDAQERHALD